MADRDQFKSYRARRVFVRSGRNRPQHVFDQLDGVHLSHLMAGLSLSIVTPFFAHKASPVAASGSASADSRHARTMPAACSSGSNARKAVSGTARTNRSLARVSAT